MERKGKFIVIEGLDGCGKSTQLSLLTSYFTLQRKECRYIHFPMLNKGVFGGLVAEFLRGEFGSIEQVHPKLVALLFANDRLEHIKTINEWLDQGYCVFADRYVYSNIAYQCAKLTNEIEKKNLKDWILSYEFEHNQLPKPDCSFFLDVPFLFVQRSLMQNREGEDRDYLNGKSDIHEQSMEFQKSVFDEYQKLLKEREDIIAIPCCDEQQYFLSKELIHQRIVERFHQL